MHGQTIKEFAAKLECSEESARGLLVFLVERGVFEKTGVRRVDGQKGKGANLYAPMGDRDRAWALLGGLCGRLFS